MSEIPERVRLRWLELADAYRVFLEAKGNLHTMVGLHMVDIVREGFHAPDLWETLLAFTMAESLTDDQRMEFLQTMLSFCSSGRYAGRSRTFILNLPRQRVLEVIESAAEPVLANDDFLDWCNILSLFDDMNEELAVRLANRMVNHPDSDISEWGRDYLKDLEVSE